jgi:hypothetical protein
VYQINRKRVSKTIPELGVNRLTRWSAAQIQRFSGASGGSSLTLTSAEFACRVELDFSTPAEYPDAIPEHQVFPSLSELMQLARESLQRGDVP